MRIVLDTNVVVSGLLWDGPPRRLLQVGLSNHQLFTSIPMLEELFDVLARPKFIPQILASGFAVDVLVARYGASTTIVRPVSVPHVAPDPDDDIVLATAAVAEADLLVTGDLLLASVTGGFAGKTVSVSGALDLV